MFYVLSCISSPSVGLAIISTLEEPEKCSSMTGSAMARTSTAFDVKTSYSLSIQRFVTAATSNRWYYDGINDAPTTLLGSFTMMESCSEPSVSVKFASTQGGIA